MSGWHRTRQAVYNRDAQIAELYNEEMEVRGLFPYSANLFDKEMKQRGVQIMRPKPGRDGWSSDRYNAAL